MLDLSLTVVLSLAVYRAARFVVRDTIIEGARAWLHAAFLGKSREPSLPRRKLYELATCPFCISVWLAAGAVALADWQVSVTLPFAQWGAVAAGALVTWRFIEE